MKTLVGAVFLTAISTTALGGDPKPLRLYAGYTTRINCQGHLLMSAIGNDQLVQLEALPSELGCGILLKPKTAQGRTNLTVETSAASILRIVIISEPGAQPEAKDLIYTIAGDSK